MKFTKLNNKGDWFKLECYGLTFFGSSISALVTRSTNYFDEIVGRA